MLSDEEFAAAKAKLLSRPDCGLAITVSLDSLAMLVVVFAVAVISPFVVDRLEPWFRVPPVVAEILLGIAVGPAVLGLVSDTDVIAALADLGLGFLMFLAGYEIELARIRGGPLRRASWSWVTSLVLGLAVGLLIAGGSAGLVIGLALTTTALGIILPIVRDSGEANTPFGNHVLAVGTVGEFGPIVAIAFILSGERPAHTAAVLAAFALLAFAGAWLARRPRPPRLGRVVSATLGTSAQVAVRLCVLVVVAMVAFAEWLGLDPVLGAFTAGILIHYFLESSDPEETRSSNPGSKGSALASSSRSFFIVSGVRLDVQSLVSNPQVLATVPLFVLLFLLIRGVPTAMFHRAVLDRAEGISLGVLASTALPLVVVITTIGVTEGVLAPECAAALVAAGIVSVLVFPIVAVRLRHRAAAIETAE